MHPSQLILSNNIDRSAANKQPPKLLLLLAYILFNNKLAARFECWCSSNQPTILLLLVKHLTSVHRITPTTMQHAS
jgi:hypothetical protein